MKLATFADKKTPGETRAGLVWGEWILDIAELPSTARRLGIKDARGLAKKRNETSLFEIIEKGPERLMELQELSWRVFNRFKPDAKDPALENLGSSRLYPPIPRPRTIRDFYAFEEHVKNARKKRGLDMVPEWYEFPAFYYSNPNVVYGPEDEVPRPSYTNMLDFELEIAAVIGKRGRDIPVGEAQSFIAGYTIMNDWSARDIQAREMKIGLGPAKAKDFATSLGPWLVTPEELEDRAQDGRYNLGMTAKINGKQVSKGNMQSIHWTFPQMIARASESVELQPGEIFGSGTVGSGSLVERNQSRTKWLKPGDVVELSIERLGTLRNRVIEPERKAGLVRKRREAS